MYISQTKTAFFDLSKNSLLYSAVSRAILKSVYWFGIPNSDPQTL